LWADRDVTIFVVLIDIKETGPENLPKSFKPCKEMDGLFAEIFAFPS